MIARIVLALVVALGVIAAPAPGAATRPPASDFSARVDNPWLPFVPGTTFVYTGVKDGKQARDVVFVTRTTKLIDGVPCVAISDRLYLDGRLAERTTDWYTQDKQGNVWYFGEATAELDKAGRVKNTEGSWRTGRDGAEPGIFMPAHPRVGQSFRQEYYKGQAEDHFRVLDLHASVSVPYTRSTNALLTMEWTPLEPGVIDHKLYVRGIGNVEEHTIKGGDEHQRLVSVTRPS
jgi:hypothetical protein